jgi:endothelin-converting enzyme
VTYPAYAKALSKILGDTSDHVIESYLVVRSALALAPYLGMNTAAWRSQRSLVEALTGIKKGSVGDRGEYCIGRIEETLGFAAGRYFVNQTFGGDSHEKSTKVITDIIKAFKTSLRNIDWMDEKSAKAAAEKVRTNVQFSVSMTSHSCRLVPFESKLDIPCLRTQRAPGPLLHTTEKSILTRTTFS